MREKKTKNYVEGKLWQISHTGRVSHVAGQWRKSRFPSIPHLYAVVIASRQQIIATPQRIANCVARSCILDRRHHAGWHWSSVDVKDDHLSRACWRVAVHLSAGLCPSHSLSPVSSPTLFWLSGLSGILVVLSCECLCLCGDGCAPECTANRAGLVAFGHSLTWPSRDVVQTLLPSSAIEMEVTKPSWTCQVCMQAPVSKS